MKYYISYTALILALFLTLNFATTANAMWVKLSENELIEQSDVIVTAEMIGHAPMMIDGVKFVIGVLKVEEVLKGDKEKTVMLLALPSTEGPHKSTDIFYKKGQKGLWFLRERKAKGEAGIYLADHPQRFLSIEHAEDQIKTIRKIMKNKE